MFELELSTAKRSLPYIFIDAIRRHKRWADMDISTPADGSLCKVHRKFGIWKPVVTPVTRTKVSKTGDKSQVRLMTLECGCEKPVRIMFNMNEPGKMSGLENSYILNDIGCESAHAGVDRSRKLTEQDVNSIYSDERSNKELSIEFSITEQTIRRIRNGYMWKKLYCEYYGKQDNE